MAVDFCLMCCIFISVIPQVYLIVPPMTPVLSGFEPAAIGSYRELFCDASQPDAGTITYKWYKYSVANGVEDWEAKGPIGTSQKYVFSPVTEKKVFHGGTEEPVSGKYICRASNSAGTRDSKWGDLLVYKPCSLYAVSVSPLKPAIGSTFTLNCYIPNPSGYSVNWLKKTNTSSEAENVAAANSKGCHSPSNPRYSWSSCSPPSISSKTHTFNLQVTNAQPADSAYWICQDIILSCSSNPVKPVIQAHPGTPQITGFPSGPVIAGTQLNLKCVASPPGDTYDWYKDGTKVTTSLSYDFQVKKESAGVYKCVARNAAGTTTSSDKTLVVYYKPDAVVVSSGKASSYVGEKDKFTCTVSGGNPTPIVKLYFKRSGGTPVEVTQGQDRVMVKEDNQAVYYCEAKVTGYPSLDMTSSKKTYTVTFANTKVSFLNNPTAAVQVGQVKKITCETGESNPITSIMWYQNIGSSWRDITTGISSSERIGVYGGKIRISEWSVTATKAMNGATVRCSSKYYLTGHLFTSNADTTIYVKFNPSKMIRLRKPLTSIHEGKLFTIVCETDSANPVANIQFYRTKRTVGTWEQLTSGITSEVRAAEYNGMIRKSTLTVRASRLDTMAVFKCEVKEGSFQLEQTTTVNVYFPPNTKLSTSQPNPVKEGDTLTLTCKAYGGNPTSFTFKWFYKNKVVPNETSKDYKITSIKYTQSGKYRCQAINYSPDGKADGSLDVDVLYAAKWNPALPESFTVESKVNTALMFTLHVIANPPPSNVTWFYRNQATIGGGFIAAKVNDTTYTLNKTNIGLSDYGNYSVNVTNDVGISYFVFELKQTGPPQTPCCLKVVNSTAISVTLTFKRNGNGGTPQTFTIEHREPGGDWIVVAKNIADPGFNRDVVQKIAELKGNRMYEFRVKAVNEDGDSGYGNIIEVKTPAAPNTTLTVNREGRIVTVSWTALKRSYSKVQIKYCLREKSSMACSYHYLKDQTATTASFIVDAIASYDVYLEVFDGVDIVYRSAPHVVLIPSGINVGMIAGVVVAVGILIAVVGAVVVVLHRRNMACFSERNKRDSATVDGGIGITAITGPDAVVHDPFYMNVLVNKAFQGENVPVEPVYLNDPQHQHQNGVGDTRVDEAAYDEPQHGEDPERVQEVIYDERSTPVSSGGNPPRRIEDISVDDFKQWLLSKRVTESTYKRLARNGFKEASLFAMLLPGHVEELRIKPLAQKILVQNLIKSFQQGNGAESCKRMMPGDGDGEEGAYEEMENPYAELNITPDVITSQTYAELKPWNMSKTGRKY
ncbi:basement membrane-specific heparan sulfate proteoglycan core protein-like [Lineus longissimus]|uniref:basement membrane-specific heparan sulfate proteoglycan core protein-like n=1 Tax=Lineus longissimus TaxID=88925 RepID=UPI00315D3A3C